MSARQLDIWCVLGLQKAASGPQDSGLPTLRFFCNNTYRLRLNALLPVTDPASLDRFTEGSFGDFTRFEASLGLTDAKPTGGTFKLRRTGVSGETAAIAFDAPPAIVQTAINALSSTAVVVTAGNVPNVFIIRPANPAHDYTFEVASQTLVPNIVPRIRKASDNGGPYTMLKIRQGYLALADDFEYPNPPVCEVVTERTGNSSRNAIQLLKIPAGAVGSFALAHAGAATGLLQVATVTPAAVESALNALFADGATAPRFRCFQAGTNGIQIECIGALSRTAVTTLGIAVYGQAALSTPEDEFAVTALPAELLVSGKETYDVVFELAGYDAENNETTLVRQAAVLVNTMLNSVDSGEFATGRTKYDTVYQTVDAEADATIIGQRSATIVAAGSGTAPSAGIYELVFTHGLGTVKPLVTVWELIDATGEGSYRQLQSSEFDARSDGNPNAVAITFPHTPPTTGNVGALTIFATNLNAQVHINEHRYDTDAIDGVGDDEGLTLTEILALIRGAMPSGWPTIPGASIAAGSIDASKLNLANLIATLFSPEGAQTAAVLTQLRELAKDSVLISNIVTQLTGNTALAATLTTLAKTVLAKLDGTPELAAAMQKTIATDAGLAKFFGDLIRGTLQDGATIKDLVSFQIPDLDLTLPNPETADGELANGDEDGFFPLPTAVFSTITSRGNITGALPVPASGNKGHYYTVVGEAYTPTRDFASGTLVYSTGFEWFPGVVESSKLFTTDGDIELFQIPVNDGMLSVGTRFAFLGGLTLAQVGNCAGSWLLKLERLTINAEASNSPGNISTFSVADTILSERIEMDDTGITHNVGFALAHTSLAGCATANTSANVTVASTAGLVVGMAVVGSGIPSGATISSITNATTFVLSAAATSTVSSQTLRFYAATKTLYTVTTAATAPAGGKWVLRGTLSRYDAQNVASPRGLIRAQMKGARASIVKL